MLGALGLLVLPPSEAFYAGLIAQADTGCKSPEISMQLTNSDLLTGSEVGTSIMPISQRRGQRQGEVKLPAEVPPASVQTCDLCPTRLPGPPPCSW